MKHAHHARHQLAIRYPITPGERFYAIVWGPLIVLALAAIALSFSPYQTTYESVSFSMLIGATLATCGRLLIAYVLAVAVAIPLSLLVTSSRAVEAILLPVFDVLESVPILALFPIFIALFVRTGFVSGAAIAILFLTMLWSIVFTLVGGIKIIPPDILAAGRIFGARGVSLIRRIVVPAVVPQFVTGSILALAQGWNIIIVAEVLHTYIPGGSSAVDLFGLGSMLVAASAAGDSQLFLWTVFAMVIVIALFNFFVWQRLLHFAQRFRFD